jgi:hypothetical protein
MRAEVSASLCSPEDRPVSMKVDPVKLDSRLSGTPTVSADPIELELPEMTVSVPEVTVELPNPTLNVTLGVGDSGVVEYLEGVREFIDSLQLGSVDPPELPDPNHVLLAAAAIVAVGPDILRAIALPKLELDVELTLGDVKISTDQALTIDGGEMRLHSVPATDDVLPLRVNADLDDTGMTALLDGLRAALTGCLVLNGGDPPPAPPGPPATVLGVDGKVDTNKKILILTIHGQGFGPVQGTVVLSQVGLSLTPVQFVSWTDQEIEVIFQPIPPPGAYAVTVTTAQGVSTQPLPVTVSG